MPAGQLRLDRVLPVPQPVHRRVDVVGGRLATPRSAPKVTSDHQARVDSLEAGAATREMTRASARSRCPARRAEQRGQPQLGCHGMHRGDVPMRQRAGDGDRLPGRHQPLALQVASTAATVSAGSADKFASVSCRTLPPSR